MAEPFCMMHKVIFDSRSGLEDADQLFEALAVFLDESTLATESYLGVITHLILG